MKAMLKDALKLFIITLIAGLALGYVYYVTKEPIAATEKAAQERAYKEVFEDASAFDEILGLNETDFVLDESVYPGVKIEKALMAKDSSGEALGYVLDILTNQGYGGNIKFSIGIRLDGTINNISILSISETAGLGMRADEVLKPQYAGKNVPEFTVVKTGSTADSQIDAISGATITSQAVTQAVNGGLYFYQNALKGGTYEE